MCRRRVRLRSDCFVLFGEKKGRLGPESKTRRLKTIGKKGSIQRLEAGWNNMRVPLVVSDGSAATLFCPSRGVAFSGNSTPRFQRRSREAREAKPGPQGKPRASGSRYQSGRGRGGVSFPTEGLAKEPHQRPAFHFLRLDPPNGEWSGPRNHGIPTPVHTVSSGNCFFLLFLHLNHWISSDHHSVRFWASKGNSGEVLLSSEACESEQDG